MKLYFTDDWRVINESCDLVDEASFLGETTETEVKCGIETYGKFVCLKPRTTNSNATDEYFDTATTYKFGWCEEESHTSQGVKYLLWKIPVRLKTDIIIPPNIFELHYRVYKYKPGAESVLIGSGYIPFICLEPDTVCGHLIECDIPFEVDDNEFLVFVSFNMKTVGLINATVTINFGVDSPEVFVQYGECGEDYEIVQTVAPTGSDVSHVTIRDSLKITNQIEVGVGNVNENMIPYYPKHAVNIAQDVSQVEDTVTTILNKVNVDVSLSYVSDNPQSFINSVVCGVSSFYLGDVTKITNKVSVSQLLQMYEYAGYYITHTINVSSVMTYDENANYRDGAWNEVLTDESKLGPDKGWEDYY